jgi:hypothetical protein
MIGAMVLGALMTSGSIDSAAAQNCTNQNALRSPPGTQPATEITFVNRGPESRRIFWIDGNGARKFYKEIGPGQSHRQPTFVNHPWVVAREDDRCQLVVIAAPNQINVDVTRSCLTGYIHNSGACVESAQPPASGANTSGCQGGSWRGSRCVCPRGQTFDAGRCVASGGDHGGINCAGSGLFYDGVACVKKCPAGTTGRNGVCQ